MPQVLWQVLKRAAFSCMPAAFPRQSGLQQKYSYIMSSAIALCTFLLLFFKANIHSFLACALNT